MEAEIAKAVKILNGGGIVIFPTDTAFGIGCRIDNLESVKKLFRIRKRPELQPVLVLVNSIEMAQNYLMPLDLRVKKLMEKYWLGALTIVYNCQIAKVPTLVIGGGKTLGIRMPNHSLILELIKEVGVPILGPSANFHGGKTPYKFEDLNPELVKSIDYVIPGQTNNFGTPSTVVDCSVSPWKILRQGTVKLKI